MQVVVILLLFMVVVVILLLFMLVIVTLLFFMLVVVILLLFIYSLSGIVLENLVVARLVRKICREIFALLACYAA
jgi:hypothetical protein